MRIAKIYSKKEDEPNSTTHLGWIRESAILEKKWDFCIEKCPNLCQINEFCIKVSLAYENPVIINITLWFQQEEIQKKTTQL